MIKSIFLAVTLALGLAACTPTAPASPGLAGGIAMVLRAARADIGNDIGGGAVLRNAYNNGDTLIFELTIPPFMQTFYDLEPEAFTREFVGGFTEDICNGRGMGAFLANGGAIRLELFSGGGTPLKAITISDCPR